DELNMLTSLGCTMVQGNFYSPPITFAETLVWIEAHVRLAGLAQRLAFLRQSH
ncbi:hypothetical protein PSA5_25950, partial [Pseudomonas syringae pv. actinidiae]